MSNAMEKNGTDRLAKCRVATILQFVNNAVSAKPNKSRVPVVSVHLSQFRKQRTLPNKL